jgi:16S rRNA (cytidine1402-2'-O)-methyltransferase
MSQKPGILYVVATPIGNLDDISSRAIAVLRSVSLIACEDTRVTAKLLSRFDIRARTVSYHEHNERRRTPTLVKRLAGGEDIALVSDAGTPGVSDPGYRLVSEARTKGISIRTLPGPSAVLAALAVSGLPTSSFCFLGFLPTKPGARRKALDSLAEMPHTVVLFESARRAPSLLEQLSRRLGPRDGFVARELTKIHEEHRAGTLPDLAQWSRETTLRGELTILVSGAAKTLPIPAPGSTLENLDVRIETLMGKGLSRREAAKQISRETGLPSREIYRRANRSDPSEKGGTS